VRHPLSSGLQVVTSISGALTEQIRRSTRWKEETEEEAIAVFKSELKRSDLNMIP
jgi:hypothetical protein